MDIVEDEVHFIFECTLYHHVRQKFFDLFRNDVIGIGEEQLTIIILSDLDMRMKRFFSDNNQHKLAQFIRSCMAVRKEKLD